MSIAYRNATQDDVSAIDRVFRESFCDTFAHLYSAENLARFLSGFTPEAWSAEIGSPEFAFRLAEAEGRLVG